MKKRLFIPLILVWMMGTVCNAEVIAPYGPGQIGLSAVVLCESLSMYQDADYSSPVMQTLKYGDRIIAMEHSDGLVRCVLGDSEDSPSGWVNADFLAIDPAWYKTEGNTAVYAWDDTTAPKVGLLDPGTTLPILRDDGDWIIVSLRGAAGWIQIPNRGTGTASENSAGPESNTASENNTASESSTPQNADTTSEENNTNTGWFTVYAEDGSTVDIYAAGGAMYEDASGRTYVRQESDPFFYCITTDVTYALDPTMWTGEYYGENEFPNEEG